MPGLHSDHSILTIELGNEVVNRGKGLWKFNNSMLNDTNNVTSIKETIKKSEIEYSDLIDRGLAWQLTKMKIRAFSVPYCVKKSDRLAFEKSLEKDLEQLQEIMDVNCSQQSRELYDLNKKDLEQIEKEEINNQMFRSKSRWTEE